MATVIWTEQALEDVDGICAYIARDSPRMAEVVADRLYADVERLAAFPRSGRIVPEFGRQDVRELLVFNFRVIYRIRADNVEIMFVRHGARLLGDLDLPENGEHT